MEFRRRVASLLRTSARTRFFTQSGNYATRQIPIRVRLAQSNARRTYATAASGRPRTTVGESSRPAKKRATSANSTKAKTSKAGKTKKAKKAKKAKPPTEKQIRLKAAKQEKEKLKSLKDTALLDAPRPTPHSPYIIFHTERAKGRPIAGDTARAIAAEYRSLSPLEKQHYVTLAAEQKENALLAFTRYLEQHTPDQIRKANRARALLRKKLPQQKSRYFILHDDRAVKSPISSYAFFLRDQYAANGAGTSLASRAAEIARLWKALGAAGKQRYSDLAAQDRSRYVDEYTNVYGHSPSKVSSPASSP